MKAIYILCVRQLKRYVRSPARIIGSLGQPILVSRRAGIRVRLDVRKGRRRELYQFSCAGNHFDGDSFQRGVFGNRNYLGPAIRVLEGNAGRAGFADRRSCSGRTLGGAIVAMAQGSVVLVICVIAGFRIEKRLLLPLAIVFMFLIALLFTSIGTVFGSVLQDMQGFPLIMNFLMMPLFFFSGAIFSADGLPKALQLGTAAQSAELRRGWPARRVQRHFRVWPGDRSDRSDGPDRASARHRKLLLLEDSAVTVHRCRAKDRGATLKPRTSRDLNAWATLSQARPPGTACRAPTKQLLDGPR